MSQHLNIYNELDTHYDTKMENKRVPKQGNYQTDTAFIGQMPYAFWNSWNVTYTKMNRSQLVVFKMLYSACQNWCILQFVKITLSFHFDIFKYLIYYYSHLHSARDNDITSLSGGCISYFTLTSFLISEYNKSYSLIVFMLQHVLKSKFLSFWHNTF